MTQALPRIPPPLPDELLGSWLKRTAQFYEIAAHELLDDWLIPRLADASLEQRIVQSGALDDVAARLRTPLAAIETMIPAEATAGWMVTSATDLAACPMCLQEDDNARRPRYRRTSWAQAFRIRCAQHRSLLVNLPDWPYASLLAWHQPPRHRRNACGAIVHIGHGDNQAAVPLPSITTPINALARFEQTLQNALAGVQPRTGAWGHLGPEEFLLVVQDVAAFVLGVFGPGQHRPLCAEPLRFHDPGPSRCFLREPFAHTRRYDRALGSMSLAHAGSVGWRRGAMFWTRELLHTRSLLPGHRPWDPQDRHGRQVNTLARASDAAVAWLTERARHWPRIYREARWRSLAHRLAA